MRNLTKSLLFLTLLAFGQGVWAQTTVTTESALRSAVQTNGANIELNNNITLSDMLTIDAGKTVTINLKGHTLDRGLKNASEGISRGQLFAIAGTLNLNGGTITGAFGTYGGNYVNSGATLNLNDVTIKDCKSKNGGGAIYNDGTVSITGGSIESCVDIKITMGSSASATGYGGAIYNNGALTISDCNINTCLAVDKGGAIYNTSGVGHNVTISGCTIKSCNSSEGGAICNEGIVTINSGTFGGDSSDDANASGDGGAIYNASNAYLTINGGTFMNNKSTKYGGGAITNQGTIYVYGGSITNNTSVGNGGGIYTNGPIYMHGNPVIENNTKVNGGTNNLYLADMATPAFTRPILVDGAFTSGAHVGFTSYDPADKVTEGYSTHNGSTSPSTYLFADNGFDIGLKDGEVYQGDMLLVYSLSDFPTNNIITSNKYIRLMANVTIDGEIVIGDNGQNVYAILDLNGYTLNRGLTTSTSYGNVIKVVSGSTLTINDNSANGSGVITGGYTDNSGGIRNEGTLYFNGGTIKNNHATSQGAGIWNTGTAYINGGNIKDNYCTSESANGGGIYNAGTLDIMGGTITGNHAGLGGLGDGIYFASGTFSMGGNPQIYDNNNSPRPNIYLPTGKRINANGKTFTEGARIGISSADFTIVSSYGNNNLDIDPATIFFYYNDSYYPAMDGYDVKLVSGQVYTVSYLDENGVQRTQMGCHELENNATTLSPGWYVIKRNGQNEQQFGSRVAVHGEVNIILEDHKFLRFEGGISVIPDDLMYPQTSLTIYAQSNTVGEYGTLTTYNHNNTSLSEVADYCAGIGGDNGTDCGPITINGGFIKVKGGKSAAGIGSGRGGVMNDITINGGQIIASGGDNAESTGEGASAIGGGELSTYGHSLTAKTITINGGTVTATGGAIANDRTGAGIGYCSSKNDWPANVVLNYANPSNISINSKTGYAGNVTFFNVFKDQSSNIYGRGLVQDNNTLAGDKTLTAYTLSTPVFDTDGDWNIADNWHTGVVPTSGNVYVVAAANIPNGYIAEAGNINLNNGGTLTIADGGQLVCSNNPYVTMKKHIDAADWNVGTSGWNFIATPTNALTINNTSHTNLIGGAEYDLYRFNQSATSAWENYKAVDGNNEPLHPDFTTLENGKGYLYARNASIDVLFMGNLANPNGTVDLAFDPNVTGIEQGFNLVGNPFACNATVNRECYVIDGGYVKATTATTIAPCTGVMVKATPENQTVTFTKAPEAPAMTHAGNNIQITLAQTVATRGGNNTTTIDNAIVSFNEGDELGKFYFGDQNANLYIPQNGKEYAIVSSNGQGEMPVNFKAAVNGEYTINVNAENVEMDYLHLIDNITGVDIDMLATPSYTFSAKSDDYASRFRLVFSGNSVSEFEDGNDDFAFISNGKIISNGTGTLQVIDMLGRIIISQDTERQISTNEMNPGVYVLRLINGENMKTQKIVIR